MKKWISVLTIIGLMMINDSCSSNDPKAVLGDFLGAYESYCTNMGKAGSADDVVATLNKATGQMKEMIPRMKELTIKFPEIKNLQKGARLPEVFKELDQRIAELGRKQIMAIGHAGIYLKDPKVMEAQKKFVEVMNEMIQYQEVSYVE
jgi:hypothetical protein